MYVLNYSHCLFFPLLCSFQLCCQFCFYPLYSVADVRKCQSDHETEHLYVSFLTNKLEKVDKLLCFALDLIYSTLFSHRHIQPPYTLPSNHPDPPPSEGKLWLGPDIPSNLLSQHRVKRARVLQRKILCAKAVVPEETWHTAAEENCAGKP